VKPIAYIFARAFAATLGVGLACYLLIYVGHNRGWLPFKQTTHKTLTPRPLMLP